MTGEVEEFRAALDALPAGFLKKPSGLSKEDARPSTVASGQGTTRNLRGAILVVIQETGRHAGHADIIREQIDGKTGR